MKNEKGIRNADGNCRLGTYTDRSGAQHEKYADIAFLDMPQSAFNAQRVYGDVTHRIVVGLADGIPTAKYGAHLRAGGGDGVSLRVRAATRSACAARRILRGDARRPPRLSPRIQSGRKSFRTPQAPGSLTGFVTSRMTEKQD